MENNNTRKPQDGKYTLIDAVIEAKYDGYKYLESNADTDNLGYILRDLFRNKDFADREASYYQRDCGNFCISYDIIGDGTIDCSYDASLICKKRK